MKRGIGPEILDTGMTVAPSLAKEVQILPPRQTKNEILKGLPMPKEKIDVGDIVRVDWEHLETIYEAEVLGLPQDVGDSWKLKRLNPTPETIINVCLYGKITLVKKAEEKF